MHKERSTLLVGLCMLILLACRAAAGLPNPFATATPTSTPTFTPTATPSPTPTFTPTPTPLPSGVTTEHQQSGQTLITDYDNQYELVLPEEWVVLNLTQEDISQALDRAAKQDPQFTEMAQAFRQLDPAIIRLIGLNSLRKYESGSYPTLLSITALADKLAGSMPMSFVTAMIEDNVMKGAKNTTWEVKNNAEGVEIGIVTGPVTAISPSRNKVSAQEKVIAFQSNKKLIMIEIITPRQFSAEVFPSADQIIDTIKLRKP